MQEIIEKMTSKTLKRDKTRLLTTEVTPQVTPQAARLESCG
jgi:hypothetical protein